MEYKHFSTQVNHIIIKFIILFTGKRLNYSYIGCSFKYLLSRQSWRWRVNCERTTDYRSRITCLNLTSLFTLFLFLLCRLTSGTVRSQLTLQYQLWGEISMNARFVGTTCVFKKSVINQKTIISMSSPSNDERGDLRNTIVLLRQNNLFQLIHNYTFFLIWANIKIILKKECLRKNIIKCF
jgi:hypothetical protein